MAYLKVQTSNSSYSFLVTNAAPAKPYLPIISGTVTSYLPLVTTASSHAGMKLQVVSGGSSYRNMFQDNKSSGTTWNTTTNAANTKLSSTTALTKATTTGTKYATGTSTTGTKWATGTSTTATKWATGTSTTGTKYATGTSTTATKYATGTSTTATKYASKTTTTGTKYATGTSTTGTKYASKTTTTGTKYATGTITTGTNYGTKTTAVNYTSTLWNVFDTYRNSFGVTLTQIAYYTHNYGNTVSAMSSYMLYTYSFRNTYYTPFLSVNYNDYNNANISLTIPSSVWSRSSDHWFIVSCSSVRSKPTRFILLSSSGNATYTRTEEVYPAVTDTYSSRQGAQLWSASDRTLYFNKAGVNTCPVYFGTQAFGSTTATTTGGLRKITIRNWLTMPYDSYSRYTSYSLQLSNQIPFLTYYNSKNTISWWYSAGLWTLTARTYYEASITAIVNSTKVTGTYSQKTTTGTTYLTTTKTSTPITYQTTTRTTTPLTYLTKTVTSTPVTYQTTTRTTTPLTYSTKTVTSTPITYSTKTVTSTPITYNTKTVTSTPITYSTKTVTSTPITYNTKTVTSTPITYNTTNVTTGYSGKVSSGSSWTAWG